MLCHAFMRIYSILPTIICSNPKFLEKLSCLKFIKSASTLKRIFSVYRHPSCIITYPSCQHLPNHISVMPTHSYTWHKWPILWEEGRQRRSLNAKEKTKVFAAVWGTEFIKILATYFALGQFQCIAPE